jgi:hypothetical protein
MANLKVRFRDYYVVGSYPDDWHLSRRAVPNLVVPREIFALSNQPIRPTPVNSSQPRPVISSLDSGSIFIWCYYQAEGDPGDRDPIPGYQPPSYPLSYHRSEVMAASDAREWDSSKFLWRRLGFDQGPDCRNHASLVAARHPRDEGATRCTRARVPVASPSSH